MAAGRRRTDVPDRLWSGAPSDQLSDHPTAPGRGRTERAAGGLRTPENPRQLSRSRLPLPPVPTGPRTTAAPFQAVPAPDPRMSDAFAGDRVPAALGAPLERPSRGATRAATPASALLRPSRPWGADDVALLPGGTTGPTGGRSSVPAPRVPRANRSSDSASPAYGDWTKPSRADSVFAATALSDDAAADEHAAPGYDDDYVSGRIAPVALRAPETTAIPERPAASRRRGSEAVQDDDALEAAPRASRGPGTGSVAGGRAAQRAQRQAADAARRKAAKKSGPAAVAVLERDDEPTEHKPRRVAKGLLAMVVVALGVLGAYSFISPKTQEVAAHTPSASVSAPAIATETAPLPPLATAPVVPTPSAVAPIRVPVTVLNATAINGLAAKVAGVLKGKTWPTAAVGAYKGTDVAVSTVYFTQGNEQQRQAAVQLVDQFPQLSGPAPRFFALPTGVTAPGLVVVLTGDWKP